MTISLNMPTFIYLFAAIRPFESTLLSWCPGKILTAIGIFHWPQSHYTLVLHPSGPQHCQFMNKLFSSRSSNLNGEHSHIKGHSPSPNRFYRQSPLVGKLSSKGPGKERIWGFASRIQKKLLEVLNFLHFHPPGHTSLLRKKLLPWMHAYTENWSLLIKCMITRW